MKRRIFVGSLAAAVGTTALVPARLRAQTPGPLPDPATPVPEPVIAPTPFGFDDVVTRAVELAQRDHERLTSSLTAPFDDLGYDAYRGIRFRRDADPWGPVPGWGLDLLPPGMLYEEPVRVNVIHNGVAQPVPFDPGVFNYDENAFPPDAPQMPPGDMGWSGFRLRTALNAPDVLDELAVFQGASYFRVLGRGSHYGISARGLALGTGSTAGEEFPVFREFWIETPNLDAGSVTIHALLDSPSVAGAFQFVITPGQNTRVRSRAALIPRRELTDVGIAPLTSMFWFGPGDDSGQDDYRPAVHDSDGVQMITGGGARLWRALSNPPSLQLSAFLDNDPQGFGLMQRARRFEDFQDAGAGYHLRPSAWISPHTNWGAGSVTLVEIPVQNEFHDNIVSFWKPADPLAVGTRTDFGYDLSFGSNPGDIGPFAKVRQTRSGVSINTQGARTFLVDFEDHLFRGRPAPEAVVRASAGRIEHPYALHVPEQGIVRLAFEFHPDGADLSDFSARLEGAEGALSETWMFRWVRD
ncbi:glucan biosynthesis protein G [Paracoccus sp. Z118]|uniref:glucan biosynthesis protein n=1 Tax=Paracoccus sp. Z118 TaxID=2851017 RepID=UPI001C2BCB63|nr:glucan biosynthesis protein G [Paracoccus sp. Z118]